MKKWLFFLAGAVIGFILAIVLGVMINSCQNSTPANQGIVQTLKQGNNIDGMTLFDSPGEIFDESTFEVFQVLAKDGALVQGGSEYYATGQIFLLLNQENKYYYDGEIVRVPQGKVVRQIGVYQYITNMGSQKTVPIIMIMNKK